MQTLPDGFRWANIPFAALIHSAYGITFDNQIEGMPGWAASEHFDIEAKVDSKTLEAWTESPKNRWKQEQQMMQSLLADRCQFKGRLETRLMPVYDLVIAKGGLKMKEATVDEVTYETMSGGKLTVRAMPIETIVGFSQSVGRLIVDKSGLTGKKFDFELNWSMDDTADAGPSLFTALEEQLGLKLVPDKGSVDVLIIDHIEKPSPN